MARRMAEAIATQKPESQKRFVVEYGRNSNLTPLPSKTNNDLGQYGTSLRERIEAELPHHWRAPLPKAPTPAEVCEAWMADVETLGKAAGRAL